MIKEKEQPAFPWDQQKITAFQESFLTWYDWEKRDLPWRRNIDPYPVWISEIMLQQTRVDTVIPYYLRFMALFPSVKELAEAPEDVLLKAWEGLGYYSRVRNLQVAARQIISEHDGAFPKDLAGLLTLKGIGPYTAGAIASIAFHVPAPAVDGNVMRVVSRLFCLSDDISKPLAAKNIYRYMTNIISHQRPGDFNQSMMDLGSSICTPIAPRCEVCPVTDFCGAQQIKEVQKFPVKSKKPKPKNMYYLACAVQNKAGEYYLMQRPSDGLLGNMWTFPLVEVSQESYRKDYLAGDAAEQLDLFSSEDVVAERSALYDMGTPCLHTVVWQKGSLGEVKHIFTHLKWHIKLHFGILQTNEDLSFPGQKGQWVKPADFSQYPMPKAQLKLLELLAKKI